MARKKAKTGKCDYGHGKIMIGIAFLIIAGLLYMEYGWMEIFAILGVLAILKGLFMMKM